MKGCFLLQRKFAPIGHSIIKHLRSMGVDEFCAYVGMRTAYDFLLSQKEIPYTGLLLDEDIYQKHKTEILDLNFIKWLEDEYGLPNLWPYLAIDRILMHGQLLRAYPHDRPTLSHEDMLKVLQVTARGIIDFLDRERPDFLVMTVIASLGSKLLYHVAKKRGIKTFFLDPTRIGNGIVLTEDYGVFTGVEKILKNLQETGARSPKEESAKNFIRIFRAFPAPYSPDLVPDQRAITKRQLLRFLTPQKFVHSIFWIIKSHFRHIMKKPHDYTDTVPWLSLWDKVKRRIRSLRGFKTFYEKRVSGEPYAFYPLHYEPEMAMSLFAPHQTNQIYLIEQIARALPVQWKLYVKEHPSMFGYRPQKYYREIQKNPNVKIIDPTIQSFDIIRGAKIVFTINGTAGLEAVFLKKPVVTFSDVFFNTLSMVKHSHGVEDLPRMVQEQIRYFRHDEEELIRFVAAVMEDSVDVDLITLWEKEDQGEEIRSKDEGLRQLATLIAKKIGLVSM